MIYDQKEVVLIPFPYSDLSKFKQRPALIISNEKFNKTEDRICCLITSNPKNKGIEIEQKDFFEGNLPVKSWIKPQRIFTINKRIIRKSLCKIGGKLHKRVIKELNHIIK